MPRLPDGEEFWMVTRLTPPEGQTSAPRMRHAKYSFARNEAQRLADKTGEKFVVLWSSNVVGPSETIIRPDDDA